MIRQAAMDQGKRIAEVAQALVTAADVLKLPSHCLWASFRCGTLPPLIAAAELESAPKISVLAGRTGISICACFEVT